MSRTLALPVAFTARRFVGRRMPFLASCGALAFAHGHLAAQVQFVDVTASTGIDFHNRHASARAGVCAVDLTGDGYPELFFNQAEGFDNQLYLNNGDGTFTDVSASWNVPGGVATSQAMFVDYDGDGLLDLALLQAFDEGVQALRLMKNTGGRFVDFPDARAVHAGEDVGYEMTAFHYDQDGRLDLFTTRGDCTTRRRHGTVYRNDGRGSFEILNPCWAETAECNSWQPVAADLNADGRSDLFVAQDSIAPSRLYVNQVDGSMIDVGKTLGIKAAPDMGVAIADYDNDGDQDIYTTDITLGSLGGNRLFQNQLTETGSLGLIDVGRRAGVHDTGTGWGASFFDSDNDGDLDLAVASWNKTSKLFRHRGDGNFDDVGESIGFAPEGRAIGLIAVDYDLDGDQDVIISNMNGRPQVYRNDGGNSNAWVKVRLVDAIGADPYCLGATVYVSTEDRTRMREVRAATSMASQEPFLLHFGIGAHDQCAVQVRWADGVLSNRVVALAGQTLTLRRQLPHLNRHR